MTAAEDVLNAAHEQLRDVDPDDHGDDHDDPSGGDHDHGDSPDNGRGNSSDNGGRRYQLVSSRTGPKADPANVRWLRAELGHGQLSWAFLRAGRVVRVSCIGEDGYQQPAHNGDDNGPATVAPLTGRTLSTRIGDAFYCFVERESKLGKFETEEWFPESDCDRALDQPDKLPFLRPLRGVTHTPLPRTGRGMLTTPGYDAESGFLYHPLGPILDVPVAPTPEQVRAAVAGIRSLITDFTWVGEHDEANYIGALLTPLMRLASPPPYKLLAVDAHQRGSGKGLLARLLRIIHRGTLRSWPATEEELGKQITGVLSQTTAPVCQIDNLGGLIRSQKLETLLTTADYTDRTLGTTNDTTLKNDRLWVVTGNNMTLGGDLDRRTFWVTIDPGVERPEDRTDFAIPRLAAYVTYNRSLILRDLLTMLAAWDAQGRPQAPATGDDFGVWVAALRGVLEHCEVPGTFDAAESRSETKDPDADEAAEFLAALAARFGDQDWTAKDVTAAMYDPASVAQDGIYRGLLGPGHSQADALAGVALTEAYPSGARGKQWRPGSPYTELTKPLGYWLRNRAGRWFDGRRVEKASARKDRAEYRVVEAQRPGGSR